MRSRPLLKALMLVVPLVVVAGPSLANVLISIDKSTQLMTVTVDGAPRYSWPVSTGTLDRATPVGSFQPFRMEEQHFSKEWDDAPMPNSIFFTKAGHAIHGSQAITRLGTPASHGCVRISPSNATTLYGLVEWEGLENTRVVITGMEPSQVAEAHPEARPSAESPPPAPPPPNRSADNESEGVGRFGDSPPGAGSQSQANSRLENTPAAPPRRKRSWTDENESVFADSFGDHSRNEDPDLYSYRVYPNDDDLYQPDFEPEMEWN
jgi:hypothetical protein